MQRFLERATERDGRASRLVIGAFAGVLMLSACGDHHGTLPEGAKQPKNYEYEVIIGESNDRSVYIFSDTRPQLSAGKNGRTQLEINGHTFCPQDGEEFEGVDQSGYWENYCTGNGYYNSYQASAELRVAVVDRGKTA